MSTCSLELDASAARRASFSHESFVLLVEHGFVHAPCVRSGELHRTSTVPPTKAPLTKDPTAFLGGYLEDPIDEIKRQFAKIKRQFEREGYEEAKEEF